MSGLFGEDCGGYNGGSGGGGVCVGGCVQSICWLAPI